MAGHYQAEFCWQEIERWQCRREQVWEREASAQVASEELKNPNPVSGAGPSILRGLFQPQCEYGSSFALRSGFSSIKSGLNWSD